MANTKTAKKEKEEETTQKRSINVARSTDYGIIYSDTARISITTYDIKLTFSVNETLPDGNPLITEMVTVALSPLHAKVLAETLTRNVAKYEEQVMRLNINEDLRLANQEALEKLDFVSE